MAFNSGTSRWRHFKFIEGKESLFVYVGIGLAYVLLMILSTFVFIGFQDKITLEMKFSSEKSFNSIYMALTDGSDRAETVMKEEKVSAIGLYSATGRGITVYGEAPETLPLSQLALTRQGTGDSTTGIYTYNGETRTIEYFRLSRLNTMLNIGTLYYGTGLSSTRISEVPEIIYVKFDGSGYFAALFQTRVIAIITVIVISFLAVLVLNIYNANRRYRMALTRHENLASLGSAARTLTHEIKNPLGAMTIQMALLHKILPPEYKEDLDVMDKEIERITNLTNRVSEFMKDPLGNPEKIDMIPFITDITTLFNQEISVNSAGLKTAYVMFDPGRARSVFENLIKNATESAAGRIADVEVQIRKKGRKQVLILVLDNGDGLPKGSQDNLFDPFYTTKAKGSGIGLAISRQFVTARHGSLTLRNRPEGGTAVEVLLPSAEYEEEVEVEGAEAFE